MKKALFIIPFAAAFIFSCSTIQPEEPQLVGTDSYYTFVSELGQTKMTVGDKEGSNYKLLWSEGDVITVTSTKDPSVTGTATLVSGAGAQTGQFQMPATMPAGTEVVVSYGPSTVAASQTQASANSKDITNIAYASSDPVTLASEPIQISLTHKAAVVKVNVSSSEFSAMKLKSVMLYSKGAAIAEDADYAEVTISNPESLASAQEVWFAAKPVAEATDFYVVATMTDDTKTVTIPVKFEGKTLAAGKVNSISLANLTMESNSCADWYEPVETRDLLDGWAYGAANTFFVCTNETDTEYNIPVKARGRFNKVSKPVYCGFVMFKDRAYNSFLKMGTNGYQGIDPYDSATDTFSPKDANTVNNDCSVKLISLCNTPYVVGTTFSVIGIYNADKELIWSFMIQRYGDSDPLVDIEYKNIGVTLMDRALGQSLGSQRLSNPNKNDGNLMSYAAFFQWGRKDPFPYVYENTSAPGKYKKAQPADKLDDNSTIEASIKHPNIAYLLSKTQNWMSVMPKNLWGVENATSGWYDENAIGHKTIYDPCPEGYRVCDSKVINEVAKNGERWERYNVVKNYHSGAEADKNHDTYFGGSCIAYPLGDGKYDYWLYSGYISGSTFGTGRPSTGSDSGALFWCNNFMSSGKPAAYQYLYCPKMVMGGYATGASYLCSVRCQKI